MSITAVLIGLTGVAAFHVGRSAFYDEAWVVQFARSSTLRESLGWAIRDRQPVAAGYLAVMHLLAKVTDEHLWLFRMPSVAAAAMVLLMTGWLAGRWCRVPALGWAACLFLLACPLFQRYATEIKQYLPAAAISVGLLIAADQWASTRRGMIGVAWLALAVMGLLLAFSTWFAVAGTGITLFVVWAYRRDRSRIAQTVAFGAVVAVVGATVHLAFNRHISGSSSLKQYWADQFLPLDWSWPAAAWQMGDGLFEQAWYRYAVPGDLFMALALGGWFAWLWREPVAASAVAAVVGGTLAANLAGIWPLGVRINLTLVVLGHLCVLAGPMVLGGKLVQMWLTPRADREEEGRAERRLLSGEATGLGVRKGYRILQGLGFAATLVLVVATVHETRGADYEAADVDRLLGELAQRTEPDDLLVMTTAAHVNQTVCGPSLRGTIVPAPWPEQGRMWALYVPLIRHHQRGKVWFAAGHHNPPMEEKWKELVNALSPHGRIERVWSGKNVALYCFKPINWPRMLSIQDEHSHHTDPPSVREGLERAQPTS